MYRIIFENKNFPIKKLIYVNRYKKIICGDIDGNLEKKKKIK